MYDLDDILSFLHFGYINDYHDDFKSKILPENDLSQLHRNISNDLGDENILIDEGIQAFKSCFENIEDGLHIIPLSGGIDSRAILAGLIDAGYKDQIITITWGSPGTWNFELGSQLVEKVGVRHETLNLTKVEVNQEMLTTTAKNGSAWTFLFDAFYNSLVSKKFGKGAIYWSGFMGDVLSGRIFPKKEFISWSETIHWLVKKRPWVKSMRLTPSDYKPEESYPPSPLIDRSTLSYLDQLNMIFRQQNYTRHVVMVNGYDYRTPFLTPKWVSFILSVPYRYRVEQYLFRKILLEAYPDIFTLPTTSLLGGSIDGSKTGYTCRRIIFAIRKRIDNLPYFDSHFMDPAWNIIKIYRSNNYIDFDEAIRKRDDFRELVYKNIQDLKKRDMLQWLDIDQIWSRHQRRIANHGDALLLLSALEINLKVCSE